MSCSVVQWLNEHMVDLKLLKCYNANDCRYIMAQLMFLPCTEESPENFGRVMVERVIQEDISDLELLDIIESMYVDAVLLYNKTRDGEGLDPHEGLIFKSTKDTEMTEIVNGEV